MEKPMKVLELLAFVAEPKTAREIDERFGGHWKPNMENLVRKKAVATYDDINPRSGERYARFLVRFYVASGVAYVTNHTRRHLGMTPRVREPKPPSEARINGAIRILERAGYEVTKL